MRQEEMLLISKESRDNLVTFLNNLVVATVTINDPVSDLTPAEQLHEMNKTLDVAKLAKHLETRFDSATEETLAVQSSPKKRGRKPKISVESQT